MRLVYGNSFKKDCEKYDNIIDFTSYSLFNATDNSELLNIEIAETERKSIQLIFDELSNSVKINIEFADKELTDCYNSIYVYYKIVSEDKEKLAFVLTEELVDGELINIPLCHTKNLITVSLDSVTLNGKIICSGIDDNTKFLEGFGCEVGENLFTEEKTNDNVNPVSVNTYEKYIRELNLQQLQTSAATWFNKDGELRSDCFKYRHYKTLKYQLAGCKEIASDETGLEIMARNNLGNRGGEVKVFGYATYDEYLINEGKKEKIVEDGTEPIQNIPGIFLECTSSFNFSYTIDNSNQIVNYDKCGVGSDISSNIPWGIFRLGLNTFSDNEQNISTIYSEKFKLIQGKYDGNWFIKSEDILTEWRENGVPVYIFESNKSSESNNIFNLYIYTDANISNISKEDITIYHDNDIINDWFDVKINNIVSAGDGNTKVHVILSAKKDNTSLTDFAPLDDKGTSILSKTYIKYKSNKVTFYMVQKSAAQGKIQLKNTTGDVTKNENDFKYKRGKTTSTFIFEPVDANETAEQKLFNYWVVIKNTNPDVIFSQTSGKITENSSEPHSLTIQYTSESDNVFDVQSEFINVIRVREEDKDKNFETPTWRQVALNQDYPVYSFRVSKKGETPFVKIVNGGLVVKDLGKYSIKVKSNCPFYLDLAAGDYYNGNTELINFFKDKNTTIKNMIFYRDTDDRKNSENKIRSGVVDYLFSPFYEKAQGYYENNNFDDYSYVSELDRKPNQEPGSNRILITEFDKTNGVEVYFLRTFSFISSEEGGDINQKEKDRRDTIYNNSQTNPYFPAKIFVYTQENYKIYESIDVICEKPKGRNIEDSLWGENEMYFSKSIYYKLGANKNNLDNYEYHNETLIYSNNNSGPRNSHFSDKIDYLVFLDSAKHKVVKLFFDCSSLSYAPYIVDSANPSNLLFLKPLSPEFDENGNYLYHTAVITYLNNNSTDKVLYQNLYFSVMFPKSRNVTAFKTTIENRYHLFGGNVNSFTVNNFDSLIDTGTNVQVCETPGDSVIFTKNNSPIEIVSSKNFEFSSSSYDSRSCSGRIKSIYIKGSEEVEVCTKDGNTPYTYNTLDKGWSYDIYNNNEEANKRCIYTTSSFKNTSSEDKVITVIPIRFENPDVLPTGWTSSPSLTEYLSRTAMNTIRARFSDMLKTYGNYGDSLTIEFKLVQLGVGTYKVEKSEEYIDFTGGNFRVMATFPVNEQNTEISVDNSSLVNISASYKIESNSCVLFTVPSRLKEYSYDISNSEYLSYKGDRTSSVDIHFSTSTSKKPISIPQLGLNSGLLCGDKVYFLEGGGGVSNTVEFEVESGCTSFSFNCGKVLLSDRCIKSGDKITKVGFSQTSGKSSSITNTSTEDWNNKNVTIEFPVNSTSTDIIREYEAYYQDEYQYSVKIRIKQKSYASSVIILDTNFGTHLPFLSTGDYYGNLSKIGSITIKTDVPSSNLKIVTYKLKGTGKIDYKAGLIVPTSSSSIGGVYTYTAKLNIGANHISNISEVYVEFYKVLEDNTETLILRQSGRIGYYGLCLRKYGDTGSWSWNGDTTPKVNTDPEKQDNTNWDTRLMYQLELVRKEYMLDNGTWDFCLDEDSAGNYIRDYLGDYDRNVEDDCTLVNSLTGFLTTNWAVVDSDSSIGNYLESEGIQITYLDEITTDHPEYKEVFPVVDISYKVLPVKVSSNFEIKVIPKFWIKYVLEFNKFNDGTRDSINEFISNSYTSTRFENSFAILLNKLGE